MKRILLHFCFLFLVSAIHAQSVYVTKSGKKYHEASCRYVSSTAFSLKLDEAASRGYTACSICKPQQTESQTTSINSLYSNTSNSASVSSSYKNSSVQCSGTTKKGTRCKHMTTNSSGYCYQHGG